MSIVSLSLAAHVQARALFHLLLEHGDVGGVGDRFVTAIRTRF